MSNKIKSQELLVRDPKPDAHFGQSIAVDNDTLLVGAPGKENGVLSGAVYVFIRDAAGDWVQRDKLLASLPKGDDRFGRAVAVDGDTAFVGARGAAYVFTRDETGRWNEQQELASSSGIQDSHFGSSLAVDDDTAVVGARHKWAPHLNPVAVAYVYTRDGDGIWSMQQELFMAARDYYQELGHSVAVDGDTVVIGVPAVPVAEGDSFPGEVRTFVRDGTGNWIGQAESLRPKDQIYGRFGESVAVDGDTLLVGAPSLAQASAVYVFSRDGTGNWSDERKLEGSSVAAKTYFGYSVALIGDVALIGAKFEENTGSASLFTRESGKWNEYEKLLASGLSNHDYFGGSVALGRDTALIGATGAEDNSGSAYVFDLRPDMLAAPTQLSITT